MRSASGRLPSEGFTPPGIVWNKLIRYSFSPQSHRGTEKTLN
jgi:hypothetical protein